MKNTLILIILKAIILTTLTGGGSIFQQKTTDTEVLLIQVFYKEKEPSKETLNQIKPFLDHTAAGHTIEYLLITDPANRMLMNELGLPTDHFPFAIAINGRTSAVIDGETIIFAKFPDFMHHIGKHPGNWNLSHLEQVLNNPNLLLPENPVISSEECGK